MNSRKGLSVLTLLVLIGVGMVSCVGVSSNDPARSPEGTPERTAQPSTTPPIERAAVSPTSSASTTTAITRETPTLTRETPTLTTPTGTATSTIPPEAGLTINCLDVAPGLTSEQKYSGVIVLRDLSTKQLLALKAAQPPATIGTQGSDRIFDPTVSPRGRFLAYRRVSYDSQGDIIAKALEIVDANGAVRASLAWQKDWTGFHWLDEERLVMLVEIVNLLERESSLSYLVIFPFTGQQEPITVTPPDVYDIDPVPYWNGWGPQVYEPTLTQVAYLRLVEGIEWAYALWDNQSAQTLVSLQTFNNEQRPVWSPMGQRFIVAGSPIENRAWLKFELYAFDRAGAISKLTNLTAYYPTTYIQSYSWSPDERYIAFWLNTEILPEQDQRFGQQNLAVLDTQTLQVTNYCLPGDFSTSRAILVSAPIWSPDGQQLILENRYAEQEQASRVILVDIARNFAAQIADQAEPVGWMIAAP